MIEIWKPIVNFEDHYEISNFGRIRSLDKKVRCKGNKLRQIKGKLRKTFLNENGYPFIVLSKENKLFGSTVHQLVAQAFIPGFIKGTHLNHIDGDKTNPHLENLEISNPSHNAFHAVRAGLVKKRSVSRYRNVTYITNPRAKSKWAASIRHAGKSTFGWKTFMTEVEAAKYVDELLDSIGDTNRLRNFPES